MIELLTILTPIALLDSTTIVPLCIVTLVMLLAGPRPVERSSAFILGIFVAYLASGLLVLLGLEGLIDQIDDYTVRVWTDPENEELIVQILLGVVLCALAWRITANRKKRADKDKKSGMTAVQAGLAGASITIIGMPGAVPYFAAINMILREEINTAQQVLALVYYNVVFVVPIVVLVALSFAMGARSHVVLDAIKRFFDAWGQRVIVTLLVILGAVLIADGIGWFLGYPLIPV